MTDREDQQLQYRIRMQAMLRQTTYNHPQLKIQHQPINPKQSSQLHQKLKGFVQTKIQEIKRNQDEYFRKVEGYDEFYSQHFNMNIKNQMEDKQICQDIHQMHNIAEILMDPPSFGNQLYLYKKEKPTYMEQQQIDAIFKRYEEAYKADEKVDDGAAQQTIRRAKRFLLKEYS